jgi:hypothetical protein
MVLVGLCYDAKMDGVEGIHPPANSSSVVREGYRCRFLWDQFLTCGAYVGLDLVSRY